MKYTKEIQDALYEACEALIKVAEMALPIKYFQNDPRINLAKRAIAKALGGLKMEAKTWKDTVMSEEKIKATYKDDTFTTELLDLHMVFLRDIAKAQAEITWDKAIKGQDNDQQQ